MCLLCVSHGCPRSRWDKSELVIILKGWFLSTYSCATAKGENVRLRLILVASRLSISHTSLRCSGGNFAKFLTPSQLRVETRRNAV